ncbi:SCF ubiquitin ligase complex subunit [Exophiala xenobiotica]|nr:SCF ubiquitin ligase complex subunit [Exophiala xenobiotica]KAK5235593.1 SCF ubiquitin ligase complex subunit [Exophiala xenobiotica]KAK5252948.1 SCF ubiquitin ligase complex subunit [Exophiala xenobiotica]KAK5295125.1 SCF ubiquitin ligase complex subunit [Exophiala xenobiotica]KAK5327429.1 SCF ubiquitin ligase complex subunit [Exophiala xenobiotica]
MADDLRSRLSPIHTRNMSTVTVESDSSDSSPCPGDDEDTDYFMAHANDSQSSLGAVTAIRDCDDDVDIEQVHRLSPISKLPPEILMAIVAKLTSTADLKSCMLVSYHWALYTVGILWHRPLCNKWSNLINVVAALGKGEKSYFPYHEMVKRLNLSAIADKINDGTVQPFMNCKGVERLTLTNCSKLTDFGVAGLVDGSRKLQALDVTDIDALTDRTLHVVAANCAKLQGLNITNCSNITDESLIEIAENCRQLKRLKLNGVVRATDASITAVARNCRSILEIDLAGCLSISSESVTALLSKLSHLRELRLAHCVEISDLAFTSLSPRQSFDTLRILDLTACEQVRDDAIAKIIPAAPRLRNLVLAKCRHITDRAVASICKLTKNLHYIHLGHCINLTDNAVIQLVKACNRIRYIDLACCSRLTDASVRHLAQLPKLRRIGLVKCQNLTDSSIMALAHGPVLFSPAAKLGVPQQFVSLERVHLSYCINLTLKGITALLHNCPRLTHLSLTGVQAFLREDLTRFCRDAPAEFTHPQRDVFCVFSGEGVQRLRDYLLRMAMDEAQREGREALDDSLLDGVDSPGADTVSDDGTIDGNDQLMDPVLNPHRHGISFATTPRTRPQRPRSLHDLPSYHIEMPFVPLEHVGPWTPGPPFGQEDRMPLAPHLNLTNSSNLYPPDGSDRRSRSPGLPSIFVPVQYGERPRSASRTPSRRHTLESSDGLFGPPPVPMHGYGEGSSRPVEISRYPHDSRGSYFTMDDPRPQYQGWPPLFASEPARRPMPGAAFRNPNDVRISYLRPEPGFSAFDANHEAIMSTIPGSLSGSRHPSRSNSPQISRVNSRSRLSNLLVPPRGYASTPPSQADSGGRNSRAARSRERSRMREEAHREAMLQALAEADAVQQLRPDFPRADSDRDHELPLLLPEMTERMSMTPVTPTEPSLEARMQASRRSPSMDADQDVTMTQ